MCFCVSVCASVFSVNFTEILSYQILFLFICLRIEYLTSFLGVCYRAGNALRKRSFEFHSTRLRIFASFLVTLVKFIVHCARLSMLSTSFYCWFNSPPRERSKTANKPLKTFHHESITLQNPQKLRQLSPSPLMLHHRTTSIQTQQKLSAVSSSPPTLTEKNSSLKHQHFPQVTQLPPTHFNLPQTTLNFPEFISYSL
jgi:hypothetical protein